VVYERFHLHHKVISLAVISFSTMLPMTSLFNICATRENSTMSRKLPTSVDEHQQEHQHEYEHEHQHQLSEKTAADDLFYTTKPLQQVENPPIHAVLEESDVDSRLPLHMMDCDGKTETTNNPPQSCIAAALRKNYALIYAPKDEGSKEKHKEKERRARSVMIQFL
jgi:hypothetical protein